MTKLDVPSWVICEAMAEIQTIIDDHRAFAKETPAEVVQKIERLVSERPLLRAMWSVGHFTENTPPADALH